MIDIHIPMGRLEKAIGIRRKIMQLELKLAQMLSPDRRRQAKSAEVRKRIGAGIRASWARRKSNA